ncbi:RNA-guided endonuclease TnpB family protein [Acidiferrobacter sp.]|uniref:RNA-guided endonuclease InsQ/TnpB family protein n=1 Tax=Acidiferrobacter sp. TaxID=1872107 RepID=UPI0026364F5F|nr:RNA-guided endonuclease TnpB family protein [Acidiferrobacter sp.]
MLMAHKIALDPNNTQATYFARAAGTARFAYNWALDEWQRQYDAWKQDNSLPKPSQAALRRQLNALKRERFPWMLEVTKNAPQMAIIQLGEAFKNFWAGRAKFPKFRKKGVDDRFTLTNDQFRVEGPRIRIPNLGWVRMRESLRFTGKILSATISRVANRWFVSITVDTEEAPKRRAENQGAVGVDLGVSVLATLSTGEKAVGPKAHKALLKRLKRLSRSLSRKQKGSRNRAKAKMRLATLHARIANIRNDALHKLTSDLTRRFHTVAIEDLHVRGMMKNHRLARSIADMSFFEFRRQREYKAEQRGGVVVVADRWFPSSKTCSACGSVQEKMSLSVRHWICLDCGASHDRDVNAARNLLAHGLAALSRPTASSAGCEACGPAMRPAMEEGAGSGRKTGVKPASAKQEVSFVPA